MTRPVPTSPPSMMPTDAAPFGSAAEREVIVEALRLRLAAMSGTANPADATCDVHKADVQQIDVHKADVQQIDVHKADVQQVGMQQIDVHKADVQQVDVQRVAAQTNDRAADDSSHRRQPRPLREPGGNPEDELGDPETVAKNICLRLLTDSARPRANLFEALKKRGIDEHTANKVLDRYAELGLIDDDAYAHAYVRTKHQERGLGKRALALELRRKGIDDAIAEQALLEVNSEDEWERGRVLIAKRIGPAMAAGPVAARRRLAGLLARRGYSTSMSYELVSSALRDFGVDDSEVSVLDDSL